MWIARPSTPSAASFIVSLSVGCACTVIAMSSLDPWNSIASTASATSSETFGPIRCAPRMRSVLRVGDELHEAGALARGARAAVGREGELAGAILAAALLHLLLGESHRRDLGPGVDDRRDRAVVHVRRLAGDHLGGDDALLLGLVREEHAADRVADGVDVREVGAHLRVDEDLAARAERRGRARRRRCR